MSIISKEQIELLQAEKEMLELESIPQFGKYTHTYSQVYIDTDYGAAKRKYISLRIKEIDKILESNNDL